MIIRGASRLKRKRESAAIACAGQNAVEAGSIIANVSVVEGIVVVLGLTVAAALGVTVNLVLIRSLIRDIHEQLAVRRNEPRRLDSRHVGLVLLVMSAVSGPVIALGASVLPCLIAALFGAALGVALALILPEWRGHKVGPWVAGFTFIAMAVLAWSVALAVRVPA